MQSIQQLRARARAAGTLVDTPQQQVDMEGDDIRIIPTSPDTIYMPEYDPDMVYGEAPEGYAGPYVTFGVGFPVGPWLGFECDWDDFGIWAGPWHPGWEYRRDWKDSHWGGRPWHPDPRRGHAPARNLHRPAVNPPAPRPAFGARGPAAAYHAPIASAPSRPNYRGYGAAAVPAPSTPAPKGELYGGYGRGTDTRAYSTRGRESRSAPVRQSAPAARSAPARSESPAPGGRDRH
jgi:hypothetical protein